MTKETLKRNVLDQYRAYLAVRLDWCQAHNKTLEHFRNSPPHFSDGSKPISDAINSPEGIAITREFVKPTTWQIHSLDVWGNSDDGFEVNNEFKAGSVEIPFNASDEELLQLFKDSDHLKETVTLKSSGF
jgi:hypothetical protein